MTLAQNAQVRHALNLLAAAHDTLIAAPTTNKRDADAVAAAEKAE